MALDSAPACERFLQFIALMQDNYWPFMIGLFVFCSLLFLTVIPLGTTVVLLAGYFFGVEAGLVQFAGLVLASIILFEASHGSDPAQLEQALAPWRRLSRFARLARQYGLVFCIVMRVAPVIPSAVASLGASYFGIGRRQFYAGIVLAGWVRPLFFAWAGSQAANLPVCT
ncbi:VTT domain-containing protein [Alteraurantiacibacter aestuarii]|uniref:VTT domain-containing protein n=1 Tax=Alteraurantiacibacter aestuarii TaxID=650004 RepID=A0A844ZHY1_9SPHN|nr:VTT domain-containing protein [Alteraurantiacibacter aestuarii]MXO87425.1 hypothetical protein [Alteraurantiacibacter aestuarii]